MHAKRINNWHLHHNPIQPLGSCSFHSRTCSCTDAANCLDGIPTAFVPVPVWFCRPFYPLLRVFPAALGYPCVDDAFGIEHFSCAMNVHWSAIQHCLDQRAMPNTLSAGQYDDCASFCRILRMDVWFFAICVSDEKTSKNHAKNEISRTIDCLWVYSLDRNLLFRSHFPCHTAFQCNRCHIDWCNTSDVFAHETNVVDLLRVFRVAHVWMRRNDVNFTLRTLENDKIYSPRMPKSYLPIRLAVSMAASTACMNDSNR